jgi:hypothetical protein
MNRRVYARQLNAPWESANLGELKGNDRQVKPTTVRRARMTLMVIRTGGRCSTIHRASAATCTKNNPGQVNRYRLDATQGRVGRS